MLKARKSRPASSPEAQGYNSSDVARICGVSLRQLQWWDERNVVSPRQDGHKRIYMAEEVVEISVIAELRRKGFSLQKIRRVLRFLQKDMGKRLSEALAGSADVHLLTDGKSIFLEEAPNRIIDLLKNARQPMFLVCVTDQVRRLSADGGGGTQAGAQRNRPSPPAAKRASDRSLGGDAPCVLCPTHRRDCRVLPLVFCRFDAGMGIARCRVPWHT